MKIEGQWRNEPPFWEWRGEDLFVRTGPETDFWNNTFYGFKHDNGHMLARHVPGDFSASCSFRANYSTLYDQAGMMLWVDEACWLKTGIEYTDGAPHFSVVVTNHDQSDWSVLPLPEAAMSGFELRVTRHDEAVRVQYRLPEEPWRMARLAFLDMNGSVEIGPMCCSPMGEGFEVTFSSVEIGPPVSRDLHG